MNALVSSFGTWADLWGESIWRASWQGAIALAVAWGIACWCTFLSPRVNCWVWRLACLKLLLGLVAMQPVELAVLPAPAPQPLPQTISYNAATDWAETYPAAQQEVAQAAEPVSVSRLAAGTLLLVWLVGVFYCLRRTARGRKTIRRLLTSSELCTAEPLARMLAEEAGRLGVRRLPALRWSRETESPLLLDIWRRAIILPVGVEEKFDETELRLMLAHELAHAKRHDLVWNWLPTVAGWLFFFHPLVWLMARRWSEAQEAACDELVIQRRAVQPADYGRLLVKLATLVPAETHLSPSEAGVLGAYRNLERRILAMARVKPFSPGRMALAAGATLLAAFCTMVPWRLVAQQPQPAEEPQVYAVPFATYAYQLQRPSEAKQRDPAAQQALDRLRQLGALALDEQDGLTVEIQEDWTGTDADLALLSEVGDIGQLGIDFSVTAATAVDKLQLKQPVKRLVLTGMSDEVAAALTRLPKGTDLIMQRDKLSARAWQRLAKIADGVEWLLIAASDRFDDARLAAVAKLGSLKSLYLQTTGVTNSGLAQLASLDHLEELWLNEDAAIGGPGYANLAGCKSLKKLSLFNMPIDAEALRGLATLTQLRDLRLSPEGFPAQGLKPADFEQLQKLTGLESLSFAINPIETPTAVWGQAILAAAAQMPALRSLSVSNLDVDAAGLAAPARTSRLEELSLAPIKLTDEVLARLRELKDLKQLRLHGSGPVGESAWTKIGALKPLVDLSIAESGADDQGLAKLAGLERLETLELGENGITGTGLQALSGLRRLKSLNLSGSPLTDEGAQWLRNFPALETLDLSKTKITDASLDTIATLANLRVLALDGTQVTADGLLKLKDLKLLGRVSAAGAKYSAEDMQRLSKAMPEVMITTARPEPMAYLTALSGPNASGRSLEEAFAELEKIRADRPPGWVVQTAINWLVQSRDQPMGPQLELTTKWIHEAIAADPQSLEPQLALADLLDLTGKTNESIEEYRKLLMRSDLKPTQQAIVQNNLAFHLVERGGKGDIAEARALVDKMMPVFEKYGRAFAAVDTRGLVELAEENGPAAVADFKIAAEKMPLASHYFHLALAQQQVGDLDAAAAALRKAEELELNPKTLSPAEQKRYEQLGKALAGKK